MRVDQVAVAPLASFGVAIATYVAQNRGGREWHRIRVGVFRTGLVAVGVSLLLGVVIILLNLAGIGPIGNWTWNLTGDLWKFCVPFAFAVVWWAWADATGYNKRREMEKMDAKRQERRERNLEVLGMDSRARRKQK